MPGPVLILAHGWDLAARALAGSFPAGDAALVTPSVLAGQGWSLSLEAGVLRAGTPNPPRAIVTLLPSVTTLDLPQIDPSDRDYVAAEITAFLLAWLHASPARKLNPPSFTSLNGDLHPLAWRALALAAGLAVPPFDSAQAAETPPARRITVVGDVVLGGEPISRAAARMMADAARLPMLALDLGAEDGKFVAAGASPGLWAAEVADAVRGWCGS